MKSPVRARPTITSSSSKGRIVGGSAWSRQPSPSSTSDRSAQKKVSRIASSVIGFIRPPVFSALGGFNVKLKGKRAWSQSRRFTADEAHGQHDLLLREAAIGEAREQLRAAARSHLVGRRAHGGERRRGVAHGVEAVEAGDQHLL